MIPDKVIEELREVNVEISRRTLLNYEKWGLIPRPQRGNGGRGKGGITDYPDSAVAEAYASFKEIHEGGWHESGVKYAPSFVAAIRQGVLTGDCEGLRNKKVYNKKPLFDIYDINFGNLNIFLSWWLNYSLCRNNLATTDDDYVVFSVCETNEQITPEKEIDFNPDKDDSETDYNKLILEDPEMQEAIESQASKWGCDANKAWTKLQEISKQRREHDLTCGKVKAIRLDFYIQPNENRYLMFVYQLDNKRKKWIFSFQESLSFKRCA
jgi:hypothetical protein